jgi:hypothetical protein
MPSDVSVEIIAHAAEDRPLRRLPIGIGLGVGACASLALWTAIAFGLRALFS